MRYSPAPMLQLSKIRAITLDLDDTLWPIRPAIERAEQCLVDWMAANAPSTAAVFSQVPLRMALRAQVERDMPHLLHDLSALRLETIRLALRSAGEPQALAEQGFAVFFAARMEVQLFDGVLDSLGRLSAKFPLLALTNGNADVERIGLGSYFRGTVDARATGVAKPDPRIFRMAAESLLCTPPEILHVGDDPHMDVLGALGVGMQAAWVNRSGAPWQHQEAPHANVRDLVQLCEMMEV